MSGHIVKKARRVTWREFQQTVHTMPDNDRWGPPVEEGTENAEKVGGDGDDVDENGEVRACAHAQPERYHVASVAPARDYILL